EHPSRPRRVARKLIEQPIDLPDLRLLQADHVGCMAPDDGDHVVTTIGPRRHPVTRVLAVVEDIVGHHGDRIGAALDRWIARDLRAVAGTQQRHAGEQDGASAIPHFDLVTEVSGRMGGLSAATPPASPPCMFGAVFLAFALPVRRPRRTCPAAVSGFWTAVPYLPAGPRAGLAARLPVDSWVLDGRRRQPRAVDRDPQQIRQDLL